MPELLGVWALIHACLKADLHRETVKVWFWPEVAG